MSTARVATIVRAGLAELRRSGNPDAAALADVLAAWLKGDGEFEKLIGAKPQPGQRRVPTQLIEEQRNRLIWLAAVQFYPSASPSSQAEQLHAALSRYSASAWLRERTEERCPAQTGTLRAACWAILKVRDYVPSDRTIRRVLATSSGYSWPTESRPD
ncbi:hypothetical protein [Bradyrhizobium sp. USDA 3364]